MKIAIGIATDRVKDAYCYIKQGNSNKLVSTKAAQCSRFFVCKNCDKV